MPKLQPPRFKIYELGADIGEGTFSFPTDIDTYETTIPASVPAGDYLLRMEHVGLHSAGAPQFYVSCAQLTVTGGGSANPAKVEIPGYIAPDDPSVTLNIYYPVPTSYDCPGPEVFTDGSSGGDAGSSSAPATSASAPATSVASSAAPSSAAPTSAAESSAASEPATSVAESSAPATSSASATSAAQSSAPAETSAPATSSAAAPTTSAAASTSASSPATSASAPASSASAPATSAPASGNTYNDCWNAYNKCAADANAAPNAGGAVDFSACESERATCLSGIARRMHRRKALRA